MKALAPSLILLCVSAFAQQGTTAAQAPNTDTSYIDPQGTAHITRVIPIPPDLSPEAKAMLARPASDVDIPQTLDQRRPGTDVWQNHAGDVSAQLYPVHRAEGTIAGVPVRILTHVAGMDPAHVLLTIPWFEPHDPPFVNQLLKHYGKHDSCDRARMEENLAKCACH